MTFLIAYDVSCPKRLRRVARVLERHALRCQKSVFLANLTFEQVAAVLDEAARHIDPDVDRLQAWRLADDGGSRSLARGAVCPVEVSSVIVGPQRHCYFDGSPRRHRKNGRPGD